MNIVIILVVVVILGIVGTVYYKQPSAEAPQTDVSTTREVEPNAPAADSYKDGTYSATGTYTSPAGQESVDVSITLKDNIVTAATFKGNATNPTSKLNQMKFNDGYTVLVVGKSLNSIQLTVVNGSSLAPRGFMDALADIKAEAKA